MFETEVPFEEMPLIIGAGQYAEFSGVASLETDSLEHDYGFQCVAIELHGSVVGSYMDKRTVRIHANCDDEFLVALFKKLAAVIENDAWVQEQFYAELNDVREVA